MVVACSKVAITGRKQLKFIPKNFMLNMSKQSYSSFLQGNKVASGTADATLVRKVGTRVANAVNQYFKQNGMSDRIKDFQWEFNVVESPDVNAWCMPGGKVVFYTGILPITKDENGIAVVMGHEIAHAIAEHGNERMSQQLAIQGAAIGANVAIDAYAKENPQLTQNIFNQAFGIGSTLGMLAFSRKHELEADKLGLVFMAMAGYNPENAVGFWQRMAAMKNGQAPPEFLSTHPHDQRRIQQIQAYLPEAKKYYKK